MSQQQHLTHIMSGYVLIQPGTFMMGSPTDDVERVPHPGYETLHPVTITKAFWMKKTPVTQREWREVMGHNPSSFKGQDDCPVENVSFDEAVHYCNVISQLTGCSFRLPTEAEWEYACRAGTSTPRYGELRSIAWFNNNSGGRTHPVAQKQPNAWGLYDMLGNVFEWCQDWLGDHASTLQRDPSGPPGGSGRVVRGGSWFNVARYARAANRNYFGPRYRSDDIGFRPARSNF